MRPLTDRRLFLTRLAAGLALATPAGRALGAEGVTVFAAPANSSILLARAVEGGALPGAALKTWRSPDELRAAIVSGEAKVFSLPVNVAANLRARGLPVRLINILSVGHMAVLTTDPAIHTLADLKGRRVQLYFRGDMPDLSLRFMLGRAGIDADKDVGIDYAGSATEAAQLLLAGRASTVLLSEPAASAVLLAGAGRQPAIRRAFTLQGAWAEQTGRAPFLPLAGVAATETFVRENPEFLRALNTETIRAIGWVVANREAAAALAEKRLGLKADAMAASLVDADIRVVSAREARPDVDAFLAALSALSPAVIGGRLPDDGFYAEP